MNYTNTIGIDLGGTNIRGGLVNGKQIVQIESQRINSQAPAEEIVTQLFNVTEKIINETVTAIGIGVPGLVNEENGIVFDVLNIPSWTEVPLKQLTEERFGIPVLINNDANCFAVGEYYFGKGVEGESMVGLTIGTGLGSGIILKGKLYSGRTCGAGEFGMIDYLDHYIEYYASGQFFKNVYNIDGEIIFEKAKAGDTMALKMYEELGGHLGNAVKTILYALEVDKIILGGSVRHAYAFFEKCLWNRLKTFAYRRTIDNLKIEISELENSGILGAAALHYDSLHK
ncbi:MAG: ROK family protein [Chitinophagaceae bacterium]|nr:ROK family protein [Chitinophagaceae bacterium]